MSKKRLYRPSESETVDTFFTRDEEFDKWYKDNWVEPVKYYDTKKNDYHSAPKKQQPTTIQNKVKGKTENHKKYLQSIIEKDFVFCLGKAGTGKAQPLTSKVYTPTGPKLMGEICVGDKVSDPYGNVNTVLQIHPQGTKEIYNLYFNNGDIVSACKEHLFEFDVRDKKYCWTRKILSVEEILNSNIISNRKNYRIPSAVSFFNCKDLSINPYILGVLIGDGCLKSNVSFTSYDEEIVAKVIEILNGTQFQLKKMSCRNVFNIVKIKNNSEKNQIKEYLKELGLWGTYSYEKFIPNDFKYNSLENRLELIKGLLDTDGTVSKRGNVTYCTTSKKLKDDIKEVLESVGCICSVSERITSYTSKNIKKNGRLSYIINIGHENTEILFSLKRKKERCKPRTKYVVARYLEKIEQIDKQAAQCISLDGNMLYLTDNFVKTHNSYMGIGLACEHLLDGKIDNIVITRPVEEAGKGVGFLKGTLEEKLAPHLMAVDEYLKHFLGGSFQAMIDYGKVRRLSLEYLRGTTFHNTYIICDEAQNCTYDQLKMLLTRIGQNSKVIILGDETQNDLGEKSGLEDVAYRMSSMDEVGIIQMTKDDIMRNGLIGKVLEVLDK